MSAAAPARRRRAKGRDRVTRGWFSCPNSFAENQSLLTPAERALALIVLRRDESDTVSDATWKNWTGLEARIKLNAVAGLRKKGLVVEGRGDGARYAWNTHTWNHYVRTAPREGKPRTDGRQETQAPKERPVHPQCVAHGCQLSAGLSPKFGANGKMHFAEKAEVNEGFAQPVANSAAQELQQIAATSPILIEGDDMAKAGKGDVSAELVSADQTAERGWSKTLGVLRSVFPLVGVAFLLRLLVLVRVVFANIGDDELAEATDLAIRNKRPRSEGLLLKSSIVADAVAALRRRSPPERQGSDARAEAVQYLARCAEQLKARGDPYECVAGAVCTVAVQIQEREGYEWDDLESILEQTQTAVVELAAADRTPAERRAAIESVEAKIRPFRGQLTAEALARLERQFYENRVLEAAGLLPLKLP